MKKYIILFLLFSFCTSNEETEIIPLETTTSSTLGEQIVVIGMEITLDYGRVSLHMDD